MDSNQINDIVRQVLAEMNGAKPATPAAPAACNNAPKVPTTAKVAMLTGLKTLK